MFSPKRAITDRLQYGRQTFVDLANARSEEGFKQRIVNKWSLAETMQHLYLSARPVQRLMTGPREVLLQWGRAYGSSRPYKTIEAAYASALSLGVKAPDSLSPRPEDMQDSRAVIVQRFNDVYEGLYDAVQFWSGEDMDEYVIPHPLMGKLTVREMLDFTSVHTMHHLRAFGW